jgi:hypothetical protein
MKHSLLIAILLFNCGHIFSQSQDFDDNFTPGGGYIPEPSQYVVSGFWLTYQNSPMAYSRSSCVYVEIGGVPYLYQFGGGNSSTDLRRVSRLNLQTNSWQYNYSTMPTQVSSGTAVPVNGGNQIYVFGGNKTPGTLGKTLRYNVASNTWQIMADMLTKVTDALVVKYSDQYIFVIGGGDGYFGSNTLKTNKVQVYNTQNDTYSYKTDYPLPCAMLAGGIYRDTIISAGGYTTGGISISNSYKGVINPGNLNITWTSIPSYPGGSIVRMASHTAVKNTGVGVMFTGGAIGGYVPTSQTHFWNFCTQSWLTGLPNNTLARSNYKASSNGYDRIYMAGGFTNTGVGTTESLVFEMIDGPCMNMVGTGGNQTNIPDKFELRQNYPNPFNPTTMISFSIPKGSLVKVIVTNIQGKEVKELTNGLYNAGRYSLEFNAENFSSGIYFCSIFAGEFRETKKMLLVK